MTNNILIPNYITNLFESANYKRSKSFSQNTFNCFCAFIFCFLGTITDVLELMIENVFFGETLF